MLKTCIVAHLNVREGGSSISQTCPIVRGMEAESSSRVESVVEESSRRAGRLFSRALE